MHAPHNDLFAMHVKTVSQMAIMAENLDQFRLYLEAWLVLDSWRKLSLFAFISQSKLAVKDNKFQMRKSLWSLRL